MDQDKAASSGPSWLAWILTFVQALAFAVTAYLFQEINRIKDQRERDMMEIRTYSMQNALWRGSIDSKVDAIREDISDVRDTIKYRGGGR